MHKTLRYQLNRSGGNLMNDCFVLIFYLFICLFWMFCRHYTFSTHSVSADDVVSMQCVDSFIAFIFNAVVHMLYLVSIVLLLSSNRSVQQNCYTRHTSSFVVIQLKMSVFIHSFNVSNAFERIV